MKNLQTIIQEKLRIGKSININKEPETVEEFADKYAFTISRSIENHYSKGKQQPQNLYGLNHPFTDKNHKEQQEQYRKFYYAFARLDGYIDKAINCFIQENNEYDITYTTTYTDGGRMASINIQDSHDNLYGHIYLYPSYMRILIPHDAKDTDETLVVQLLDYIIKYYNEH